MDNRELAGLAVEARKNAYVPYSGYKVGAALLTKAGKVYQGCNIENAAYSPTNCAERTAVFKAVSEGELEFEAMAVAGGKGDHIEGGFPPCGVCRQVLVEFCDPETFRVIIVKPDGLYDEYKLKELLPLAFSGKYLNR